MRYINLPFIGGIMLLCASFAVMKGDGQESVPSILEEVVPSPPPAEPVDPEPIDRELPPGALEVSWAPVKFLVADAAVLVNRPDGRAMVITEGLDAGIRHALAITVENSPVNWIEAYPDGKLPAMIVDETPGNPGSFVVEGKPGQLFDVRISNGFERPTWLRQVQIPPSTGPVDPGPTDPPITDGKLTELSKARADAVNDPPTRTALKAELLVVIGKLEELCASPDQEMCPPIGEAAMMVEMSLEQNVFMKRTGPSRFVNWRTWRDPVGEALKEGSGDSVPIYISLLKETAEGL